MKSWIFAFVGFSCFVGSLTVTAHGQLGQGTPKTDPPKLAVEQKPLKEVKFRIEWTGASKGVASTAMESVTITGAEGEMSMSNNPLPDGSYRKVVLRPEGQHDGSYLVDISVSESTRDQDIPRMSTVVKIRKGETKIVQSRLSKNSNGESEYTCAITPMAE